MTVPDPLSDECEKREHGTCPDYAWNLLTDSFEPCTCHCHPGMPTRKKASRS